MDSLLQMNIVIDQEILLLSTLWEMHGKEWVFFLIFLLCSSN